MQSVNAGGVLLSLSATYGLFPVWAAMFATSGCRSLLQSFEDTFLELMTVENPNITVGILTLSIAVPEIQVFPVWAAILLFPVVGRCCKTVNIGSIGFLVMENPYIDTKIPIT